MKYIEPKWDQNKYCNETVLLNTLVETASLTTSERNLIVDRASELVEKIRHDSQPGLMDVFLAEYGLSTDEGVALMCLAEAMLRVPDATTIDALIEDKIAPSDWSDHLGQSSSPLVNASTWGLMLTGKVLTTVGEGVTSTLRTLVRRLGEPVVRVAVGQSMKEMGRQFVLGETISTAMKRAQKKEKLGFTHSYDMLGEAAITMADAKRYLESYSAAITSISEGCNAENFASNPGISVKLSALHPRYEVAKSERIVKELLPALKGLAVQAKQANMGLNIDAEEADRLALSLKLIEAILADSDLEGWDGFGIVVQAYGRRASEVIDGLYEMAQQYDRKITVRLVKGAYWDTEIKLAQVEGLEDFPVFTQKAATDVSYLANARKLLKMTDRIYPQFATHNAHSVAAILEMAKGLEISAYEFQRLHGMGEALHDIVHQEEKTRCRIYAPVGAHRDLLAYLVRRLLENGANSSFVNQIVDKSVDARKVAACPFEALAEQSSSNKQKIPTGKELFAPERKNSKGFDLSNVTVLQEIEAKRKRPGQWRVEPMLANAFSGSEIEQAHNPSTGELIGEVVKANEADVALAFDSAQPWSISVAERAEILRKAADLYEDNSAELFALLATEAGKTLADSVAELREAVDFLHYYAYEAEVLTDSPRGTFVCISPWNFPLAIFTGQIAAALASGNAVLAKPAETTPAIAAWGVRLLREAGVPETALQLLPGHGSVVGQALVSDARVKGVAFTGSTATARRIQAAMAENAEPGTPLIAETGGLNAMIVDSTALPEQAVRDIVASAFQSAGQRCSALRCLYVQEDIAPLMRDMLIGAMDELELGDPWKITTDIGPVITADAQREFQSYVGQSRKEDRLIHELVAPAEGNFMAPSLLAVDGIEQLEREIFGPILHFATFKAGEIDQVIDAVNATGFGLTFGLHTRIDQRVQQIADRVNAGNVYANRNQIGAIVGSQPFGGEGLSGTGPKAGGPNYLKRFTRKAVEQSTEETSSAVDLSAVKKEIKTLVAIDTLLESRVMPGPTGELNRYSTLPRPPVLCLGPGKRTAQKQKEAVESLGGQAVIVNGPLSIDQLSELSGFSGLLWWGEDKKAREYSQALARLDGPIIPLITAMPDIAHVRYERHLCVDTTAAGGNTALLAGQ